MIRISKTISIPLSEIEFQAVRSQGPGGQHVNKVSTAIQLKFEIHHSGLPEYVKKRLINLSDNRITKDGIVIIKSQSYRSQNKNKDEAIARLKKLISAVLITRKRRVPTSPTKASEKRRLETKKRKSKKKQLRQKINIQTIED